MKRPLQARWLFAVRHPFAGGQSSVSRHPLSQVGKIAEGMVFQQTVQPSNFAVNLDLLVHGAGIHPPGVSTEQAQVPVGEPFAVSNPPTSETDHAVDQIASAARFATREQRLHILQQRHRHNLVGVKPEDPRLRCRREQTPAHRHKTVPLVKQRPRSSRLQKSQGLIHAAGVQRHDFCKITERRQRPDETISLVLA